MKKQTVTIDELASHWAVTSRRVRQLADEISIPIKAGKFDVFEADRLLIRWLQRDEPTRRSKRELMAWQRQRIEAQIAREDRQHLRPDEVKALIDDAWGALRQGHLAALNAVHRALKYNRGDRSPDQLVNAVEAEVNGWMALARDRLEDAYRDRLADMESATRNGIIEADRRIATLREAIGPDA
jgi:hypothetical protein